MWIRVEKPRSGRSECRNCSKVINKEDIRVQVHKVMDNRFYHIQCYKNVDPPESIKVQYELQNSKEVQNYQKKWEEEFTEKYSKKKRKIETIYNLVETVKKRKLDLQSEEFFFDLPNDIWILILSFAPFRDIVHNFSVTCKSCLEITYEDGLWRELNLIHFGQKLLHENFEEFGGEDNFKLFIKLQHEICMNCKSKANPKYDYFMPRDCLICSSCSSTKEFELLTISAAKTKYKLSDDDLKKLKYQKEWNPNNKKVPKISYLKTDLENLMFENRKKELIGELKKLKVEIEDVDFSEYSMAHDFIIKNTKSQAKSVAKSIKTAMPK
eukprot:gene7292-11611_t